MSYSDHDDSQARQAFKEGGRQLAEKILVLMLDAQVKQNECGLNADEVAMDLETRVALVLDDVLPQAYNQIAPRPNCSYAFPNFCHTCGQKPGAGSKSHGCEDCVDFRRINEIPEDAVIS